MRRLRPLTEAECYARCYGELEGSVTIVRVEPRVRPFVSGVSGEQLRRRFEELLETRDPEEEPEAA